MRTVLAVVAFASTAAAALAQPLAPLSPPPPAPLPPEQVRPAGVEPPFLQPGVEVSQPLTPVGPAPAEPPKLEVKTETKLETKTETTAEIKIVPVPERPRGPLGPNWSEYELLYWWPTRQPVPPLVVGTRSGLPPVFGDPDTRLLIGGHALDSEPHAGGRFTLGSALNNSETFGYEITYFFLGTRTSRDYVSEAGSRVRTFGLPYTDAATGANGVIPLAQPGVSTSSLVASTSTRVQGWEVNTVANVLNEKWLKVNGLVGWRYFQAHEGLRLQQTQWRFADPAGVVQTADQFDAHNRFHGGQIGLHADAHRGIVFCEMTAKVAFGRNYEVVKNEGMTHLFTPNGALLQTFGGSGVYVQPSNAGRTANGAFAVVPEGTIKFGFRLGDAGRVYLGYSFLYLSDAVRPGDGIDRTLNPAQVPLVSGAGPVYGSDRPGRIVNRSDFWVQGLVIGLEARY